MLCRERALDAVEVPPSVLQLIADLRTYMQASSSGWGCTAQLGRGRRAAPRQRVHFKHGPGTRLAATHVQPPLLPMQCKHGAIHMVCAHSAGLSSHAPSPSGEVRAACLRVRPTPSEGSGAHAGGSMSRKHVTRRGATRCSAPCLSQPASPLLPALCQACSFPSRPGALHPPSPTGGGLYERPLPRLRVRLPAAAPHPVAAPRRGGAHLRLAAQVRSTIWLAGLDMRLTAGASRLHGHAGQPCAWTGRHPAPASSQLSSLHALYSAASPRLAATWPPTTACSSCSTS